MVPSGVSGVLVPVPGQPVSRRDDIASRFDYLYVSHTHEDHFDRKLLEKLDRNITVLCPAYRTKALQKRFAELGFRRVIPLGHRQSVKLAPGFTATILLDTGHKEDSGLLLDMGGFRFLDLNDCNTALTELSTEVDLLAAQFSGAMWYPNCYDYPHEVMRQKVARVRDDLMKSLASKCRATQARSTTCPVPDRRASSTRKSRCSTTAKRRSSRCGRAFETMFTPPVPRWKFSWPSRVIGSPSWGKRCESNRTPGTRAGQ